MSYWLKAKLLCSWLGHRYTIKGLTGRYDWCHRCAHRQDNWKDKP